MLVVEVAAGLGAATLHALDVDGLVLQVLRPLGGGDNHASRVVRLQAAVQQVRHRPDDPP